MDSNPALTPNPAPMSMRATWPGTDVIIELVQEEGGYVSATFPQTGKPNDILYPDHDAEIIRKLGFYLPDHSVPAKECGEMGAIPVEGSRNSELRNLAIKCRGEGLSYVALLEEVSKVNERCVPPLPYDEVVQIVTQVVKEDVKP